MPTETAARPSSLPPIARFAKDGRQMLIRHVRSDLAQLEAECKTLRETLRTLEGHDGAAKPARARQGNGARKTSRKPAGAPTMSEKTVLAAMPASTAIKAPVLAGKLNISSESLLRHLRAMEARGIVKREGERAQTRWRLTGAGAF